MLSKIINIWEGLEYLGQGDDGFIPKMTTYILDGNKNRPAVLIFPGGGYRFTSPREAEPIALKFNSAGYHAFVLHYSVAPRKHPQMLLDASRAMNIIRENADSWKIDDEKIAVCGFSAGGHLAASLGVHWNKSFLKGFAGLEEGKNKPNALILCYPVICSGEFANVSSIIHLLGENSETEMLELMALEKQINSDTPECFIWHTFEDTAVPVENSFLFAQGLRRSNIPFELHIYPKGPHGLSLATEETDTNNMGTFPHVASWMKLCLDWLKLEMKF